MTAHQRTIFIFSLEPWGDMWYSKHHYAARLARSHKVYFVSLPDRWRWTDMFSFGVTVRAVAEGVNVVAYRNNLPLRFLPGPLARLVNRLNALKLRSLLPDGEVLFWCFHPTTVVQDKVLRKPGTRVIYHVVDPYQNLPNDSSFAKGSDLVVAINPWYLRYYSALNANCVLVPHGVRADDRTSDPATVKALQEKWGRYLVLATGLSHYLNYELLIAIAQRYPGLRMVIAGQSFHMRPALEELRERLFALPNVTYVGVKHPGDLKDLIRGAVAGLLTYDFEPTLAEPIAPGRTPLKVLTYLAQLCPVVSTNNSYVPALEGKGYFKAEDKAHFLELVGDIVEGRRAVDAPAVNTYLDSVDYDRLIVLILEGLDRARGAVPFSLEKDLNEGASTADPPEDPRKLVPLDSPILIVSNEGWSGPRYSKHRFAIALSARRRVFFIDPTDHWKPAHLFRTRIARRATPEGITVLSYHNAIPLLGGRLGGLNDRIINSRLRAFLKRANLKKPLFWAFDPSRLANPAGLDVCLAVYHCADDHAFRWRGERLLAERCDHVFCVARDLMPRFKALSKSVHHLPHGLSDADMAQVTVDRAKLPAPPGYGLYIGNINDRHDFALWEKLFQANPDVNWVIVGPRRVEDPIGKRILQEQKYANVMCLPEVPYSQLRELIAGAGFGFLYMRPEHPANRISSQKIVQFLGQGKPIFSSWFSEYSTMPDLVYMTDDHGSALLRFKEWRKKGEPANASATRLAFARQQHFTHLLDQLPFRF
ncbi:MAG: hypothetical protein JNL43_09280 [Flavobacteriales bacterium]|nr:hypothetical protein [Flavobacteriales bacterium]